MFAMKSVPSNTMNESELLQLKNELVALANLQSDYSVNYYETFYFKNSFFMITELIEVKPIADVIKSRRGNYSEEFC